MLKAIEFLQKENVDVGGFSQSPCLLNNCLSNKKFCNALKLLSINSIEELIYSSKYRFVYHGTTSINNVESICCGGWDVTKRGGKNGQSFGVGEYFTNMYHTGYQYACGGSTGGIILAMIINESLTSAIQTCKRSPPEIYFIVQNSATEQYCLPVGVLNINTQNNKMITKCPNVQPINIKSITSINGIQYYDCGWIEYDSDSVKQINNHLSNKNTVFIIKPTSSRDSYQIDINQLTQKNIRTEFVRTIKLY
jgi:hypothetical protein